MGSNGNGKKKKFTTFKNVMISIVCAMFAAVYAFAVLYAMQICMNWYHNNDRPAWLDRVEIHVEDDAAMANNQKPSSDTGTIQKKSETVTEESEIQLETEPEMEVKEKYSDGIEPQPRFDEKSEKKSDKKSDKKEKEEPETEEPESEETQTEEPESEETKTEEPESEETQTEEEIKKNNNQIKVEKADIEGISEDGITVLPNVTSIVRAVMPCIVSVRNEFTTYDYWYDEMVDEEANASGIIVAQSDDELMMVTNYHVIEDYNTLHVTFINNEEVTAYVKGTSPKDDIAVISVDIDDVSDEVLESIAIAVLGDSQKLEVGEPAIAIGNALGYGQSVTTGIISAFNSDIFADEDDDEEDDDENGDEESGWLIQTDAAINPGNSGGALLNSKGEVIGICQGKIADYVIEGMGYAIPVSRVEPIIEELIKKETKKKVPTEEKGFLGVVGTDVSEEAMKKYDMPEGVYVSEVIDGTAAQKAGILKGDIIVSVAGEKTSHMTEIQKILEYYTAGTKVEVIVMRRIKGEYTEENFDVVLQHKK